MSDNTETAILAGGCFWGVQELLRRRDGVLATRVGYTALRLMGVDKPSWGVNSNNTSQEIGEILA